MSKRIAIKNHVHEIQLIQQRCIAVLILVIVLIGILIFRLGHLQLINHTLYSTLSNKNSLDLIPLEPTRGLIYDRNGILLAENIPIFSLDVIPYKVKNLSKLLPELSQVVPLSNEDITQFQKQLKQHRRFDEVTLKLHLSEIDVARFAENQYRFPGVIIKARLMRHYPFNGALSHALGFVGRINTDELDDIDPINYSATNYIGKLGIEKYYEDELHGTVGYERVENDASGEPVRVLSEIKPIPGKNLTISLDSKLQAVVEEAFQGHRGALVAIQPSTGQILAIISAPTYDPNLFVDGIDAKSYRELQQSTERPLYNRALRGLYPLASTIKPYMALEGMDSGVTNLDYMLYDPGWYKIPGSEHVFHDWRHHGHGTVNLTRAIIGSCDTYFYELAHKMGIKRIDEILRKFGFGDLTGVDIGEELPGLVSSPEWKRRTKHLAWYEGDTIISGIGQGYMQATPLQLAAAVATMANRGERISPHFLIAEQQPGGAREVQPTPYLDPVQLNNKNNWAIIIDAMQQVITSPAGTGMTHFGKNVPYTVAAKTGTAQVFTKKHHANEGDLDNQMNIPERLRDHSLFIAFAPADKPEIAVAVLVENSTAAAGVARKVLDYYLIKPVAPVTQGITKP